MANAEVDQIFSAKSRVPVSTAAGVAFFFLVISVLSCSSDSIEIHSFILRDRVIVTDRVFMKKGLYVAFSVAEEPEGLKTARIKGELLRDGERVSECSLMAHGERNGNLIFDLPYEVPEGAYTITIDALSEKGSLLAHGSIKAERSAFKSAFTSESAAPALSYEEITHAAEQVDIKPTKTDESAGYILFSRSPLEYVFPASRPRKSEIIDRFSLIVARNEFEPLTFSVYPLRDLGPVTVEISDLRGPNGAISRDKIKIGHVETVQETMGFPEGKFLNSPGLIRPGDGVELGKDKCQSFWLTFRIDRTVAPGAYKGKITISPNNGLKRSVPVQVTVAPITLEDIPGVDYFMMMTYEFTELTRPWGREEKEKIYKSASNILKDYKDHGMTTVCPHSPFVFIANDDGTPYLEDIFATLKAAKEAGFERSVIWYMGHLIQTSKPRHPGNILSFDDKVHFNRLKYLVETVSEYAKKNGHPEVIFLPIDEPDDAYQDVQNKRQAITPLLLKTIKAAGAKTMLTARSCDPFGSPDYLCSSEVNPKEQDTAHGKGVRYWVYNNKVPTECRNPAYARYIYGYYTWKNKIDGMSSWTFQNTQNASGLPMIADAPGRDLYLAYPDPQGPLATLRWEAVREGIDDHKLIYQLMKRIGKLKQRGIDTSRYDNFLAEVGKEQGGPGCQPEDAEREAISFHKNREGLISLILEADRLTGTLSQRRNRAETNAPWLKFSN